MFYLQLFLFILLLYVAGIIENLLWIAWSIEATNLCIDRYLL